MSCKDGYEVEASDFEACEISCVGSASCGYFAFSDDSVCVQADYDSNCDVPDNLVPAEGISGGVFMLFCAMQGSSEKTCDVEPLGDSAISKKGPDRTLTNCYDRCFEDEEKDDDCSYFAYHEHTQMCELFPHCDSFASAPAAAQSLVYMMHEEAWGKSGVGADERRRRLSEERKLYLGKNIDASICADVTLSAAVLRAKSEQEVTTKAIKRSGVGGAVLVAGVGCVVLVVGVAQVWLRRREVGMGSLDESSALAVQL
jgi:hypothetical protein